MPMVMECVAGAPKGKRVAVVEGKPLTFKIRKHDRDVGHVAVSLIGGQCVITNHSELPCHVNGQPKTRCAVQHGDEVVIGKNTFRMIDDGADGLSTQQLEGLAAHDDAPAAPVCSVCDGIFVPGQGWSDGDRRICKRCLVKGVKPEHLPRPKAAPRAAPRPAQSEITTDEVDVVALPDPVPKIRTPAPDDRHAKRISASRLSVVEPSESGGNGIMRKVSNLLGGGRAERQRLEQLERERHALLVEAGRLSLGSGGSFGLPEEKIGAVLGGQSITVEPNDLSGSIVDKWRSQRERVLMLDTEIAALRKALNLGPDAESILMPPPALRPETRAHQERAFVTLDGVGTEDLDGDATYDAPTTTETRPPGPSKAGSSGRRPARRRR